MVSKNKLFIFFSIFFLIGIFINNSYNNIRISSLILLITVIFFFTYFIFYKKFGLYLIVISLGYVFGVFISTYNYTNVLNNETILHKYYDNSKHEIIIEIVRLNSAKEYNNEYVAILKNIDGTDIKEKIKLITSIPSNFSPKKGYKIKTTGKLYVQKNSPEFKYKNYLLSKNIYFKTYSSSYEITNIKKLNVIEQNIINLREKMLYIINKIYPKEEAIFLGGILVGARENLPKNLKTDFNNSGLTHFIAVSGFNITILIIFISYLFKIFPIFIRLPLITLSIIFFTVLVGDSAPVIRASIMGLIGYYILISGRKGHNLSIILLTAIIMSLISPLSLNYDISMHLSFLAVLGIIYTQKFFEKIFYFLPSFLEIKSAFTLTLSSLSFTLPIIVLNFGQMSIMAPFANIAVAWTIPLAMLFGFLSILVNFVHNGFSYIIGYFAWIFLKWDIIVVHFFGNLDWAILKFNIGIYKNHIQILYFLILIFTIIWFRKKEEKT